MTIQSAQQIVSDWLSSFSAALVAQNARSAAALFHEHGFWRDIVSFTWNIHTAEGRPAIQSLISETVSQVNPTSWKIVGNASENMSEGISAWLLFQTNHFHGKARLNLKDGLAYTFLTTAIAVLGHEERTGCRREIGAVTGVNHSADPWAVRRARERTALGQTVQPYVVIVGGGQAGVMLAARLKRHSVPFVILEKNDKPGDSWRNRYKSLYLHDAVWYDHFPYIPFPEHWPVYSSKDQMADWIQAYVRIMDLDYWTQSTCVSASFDNSSSKWTVKVDRKGELITLTPNHLVLATGVSGFPNVPELPGKDVFSGVSWHSSQHRDSDSFKGKNAVVVGSNNSAHDIAQELWEAGAHVTMIQRSSTLVIQSETSNGLFLAPLYSEDAIAQGVSHEVADLLFASIPYRLLPSVHKPIVEEMKVRDKEFYNGLEKAGFWLDFGDDGSGHFMKYLRRGSGYYINVGASELVIRGDIAIRRGDISEFTQGGIKMRNGEEIAADVVVFATGYGSMNGWAAQLISEEVADKVGKVWGLGSNTTKDPGPWEGELRNMWKPTQQEGLWFHGGNLHQCRHYSLALALQLKARYEGIQPHVYKLAKVFHKK